MHHKVNRIYCSYFIILISQFFIINSTCLAAGTIGYICGEADNRSRSSEPRVGLVFSPLEEKENFLTSGFLVSKTCLVASGYFKTVADTKVYVSFNNSFDKSLLKSEVDRPTAFAVDTAQSTFVLGDLVKGESISVLKLKKNNENVYPGDRQGFFPMSASVAKGDKIKMIGFDFKNSENPVTKKVGSGTLYLSSTATPRLLYQIDATGGAMGGVLINGKGEAVGVHAGGYCSRASEEGNGNFNFGYHFVSNSILQTALERCISLERQ